MELGAGRHQGCRPLSHTGSATAAIPPPKILTPEVGWFRSTFFGAKPSTGDALPALDGIRALAVLAIFARHAWGLTGQASVVIPVFGGDIDLTPLVMMMSNGVDLFFVLSGFLLARAFISADQAGRPAPDLRRYFRARAFRIMPAYYVVLFALLVFFVPGTLNPDLVYSWTGFKAVVGHLTMLQTIFPFSYGMWGPGSPFWTLSIEVIFYALVPWLARLFFRQRWLWALPLCAAITFGWMWFVRASATPLVNFIVDHGAREGAWDVFARFFLSKQFPGHLFDFAIGMTVAALYVRQRSGQGGAVLDWLSTRVGSIACMLAGTLVTLVAMRQLGIWSLTYTFYDGAVLLSTDTRESWIFYLFEEPSMAFGFGLLILGAVLGPPRASAALSVLPLRFIGIIGYGVYLWHMPFLYQYAAMPWITRISPFIRWFVLMGVVGLIVGVVSTLTYLLVERPMINLGRGRSRRQSLPSGIAS